ncbi:hypothetical protein M501DRAFT_54139 [Patellaria atrata CBS 101060]|uniref:Peptidase A1 domain-containing protein n=1 Tax=Patellaria atrata CBS 101060 TaxID=1346257 RepID=A0A9P4SIS9_9PEZI|nr:hypothetical protein M501DRAFT_54139 [Patellaria atrata CBS 101060]
MEWVSHLQTNLQFSLQPVWELSVCSHFKRDNQVQNLPLSTNDSSRSSLLAGLDNYGIISNPPFGIWFNRLNISTGTMLIGALDRRKFEGQLHALPTAANPNSTGCGGGCKNLMNIHLPTVENGINGPTMETHNG